MDASIKFIDANAPAEVWIDKFGKSERLITHTAGNCIAGVRQFAKQWRLSSPGRTAIIVSPLHARLYYSDGKFAASVDVDLCPAPAHDEPGQPRKSAKAA